MAIHTVTECRGPYRPKDGTDGWLRCVHCGGELRDLPENRDRFRVIDSPIWIAIGPDSWGTGRTEEEAIRKAESVSGKIERKKLGLAVFDSGKTKAWVDDLGLSYQGPRPEFYQFPVGWSWK